MRPADEIKRQIRNAGVESNRQVNRAVLNELLNELDATGKEGPARDKKNLWRIIMKNKIANLAVAAVVIAAAILMINHFGGSVDGLSVAWGEVIKRVEAIDTCSFRRRETQQDDKGQHVFEYESMMYQSLRYGSRMDSYMKGEVTVSTYVSATDGELISMIHPMKQYSRAKLPPEQLNQMREGIRARIRQILSLEDESLGRRTIGGIEAEGIKVTDMKLVEANFPVDEVVGYLWVDVETGLPVLMEIEVIGKGGSFKSKSVIDQFEWNVELEAGFFEPVIPEDYTLSER